MSSIDTSALGELRLHHVGIVVADLNESLQQYRDLGFSAGERFPIPEQSVVAVTLEAGAGYVELIQPTDPDGPIARFLEKRGNTMHHVAYEVDDIQHSLASLHRRGVRLIDQSPRIGAHGWQVAFIHPEACSGVLTELVQTD